MFNNYISFPMSCINIKTFLKNDSMGIIKFSYSTNPNCFCFCFVDTGDKIIDEF